MELMQLMRELQLVDGALPSLLKALIRILFGKLQEPMILPSLMQALLRNLLHQLQEPVIRRLIPLGRGPLHPDAPKLHCRSSLHP